MFRYVSTADCTDARASFWPEKAQLTLRLHASDENGAASATGQARTADPCRKMYLYEKARVETGVATAATHWLVVPWTRTSDAHDSNHMKSVCSLVLSTMTDTMDLFVLLGVQRPDQVEHSRSEQGHVQVHLVSHGLGHDRFVRFHDGRVLFQSGSIEPQLESIVVFELLTCAAIESLELYPVDVVLVIPRSGCAESDRWSLQVLVTRSSVTGHAQLTRPFRLLFVLVDRSVRCISTTFRNKCRTRRVISHR
jgi:hypothetical protein